MIKLKVKRYKYLIGLIFLSGLIALLLLLTGSNNNGEEGEGHFYRPVVGLFFKLIFILVIAVWIFPRLKERKKISSFITEIILWLVICFFAEQFVVGRMSNRGIMGFHHGEPAGFNPFWWLNLVVYIFILMVLLAWYFTGQWIKNEKQKRELIESQYSTELKYLKNQVNPHFLFNTLNNLFSIAQRNNDDETAGGISKLAGLMRYMLYDSSVTNISLEKEIKNISDYISLSKLRYPSDEVSVNLLTEGEITNSVIAPMLLLPFVENAFKHGVDIEKKSEISVLIKTDGNKIIFTCINPVADKNISSKDDYGGIGLENVKRRLALLYPNRHKLEITETLSTFKIFLELEN